MSYSTFLKEFVRYVQRPKGKTAKKSMQNLKTQAKLDFKN